jgi:hypothetical protein
MSTSCFTCAHSWAFCGVPICVRWDGSIEPSSTVSFSGTTPVAATAAAVRMPQRAGQALRSLPTTIAAGAEPTLLPSAALAQAALTPLPPGGYEVVLTGLFGSAATPPVVPTAAAAAEAAAAAASQQQGAAGLPPAAATAATARESSAAVVLRELEFMRLPCLASLRQQHLLPLPLALHLP